MNSLERIESRLERIEEQLNDLTVFSRKWLDRKEAAKYLNKSLNWVDKVLRHLIPVSKVGGAVFFLREDIDDYMESVKSK